MDSGTETRSHGGNSGQCPPNFVVPRKICFKSIIKTKRLAP